MTDPIHSVVRPGLHWTTTNVGEAAPGVQTPLSWTLWSVGDYALREMGYRMGVLNQAERRSATPADRVFDVFYGRCALQVEFLVLLGDRMPGATGRQVATSILGRTPDDLEYHPTRARHPAIAARFPRLFVKAPSTLKREADDIDRWYANRMRDLQPPTALPPPRFSPTQPRQLQRALTIQGIMAFAVIEPLFGAVEKIVAKAGRGDVGILSGTGGAESAGMVGDLWDVSRERLQLHEFIARHGFHGPAEGEVSSRVWRQDPTPLHRMIREYANKGDDSDPRARDNQRLPERRQMVPDVVAAFPRPARPAVRGTLELAARRLPLRGIAKRSMLQAFDVARAAAEVLGNDLTERSVLRGPGDVHYLTVSELTGALAPDTQTLVDERRQAHAEYRTFDIPGEWVGEPPRLDTQHDELEADSLSGIGVSSGVIEGRARVVLDPAFDDVEDGEILIAPTTDPSWATILMLSSALVVDIGGALSHAAVVAREFGIPCIVNTRTGTRTIRTGDRIRVDGSTGTIEILERSHATKA